METWPIKLAWRLAWAFPGRTIDEGNIAAWAEELAELDPQLAVEVIRRMRRDWHNPPSVADLLDVVTEIRLEEGQRRPALPERASWTDEDEREAQAASERELARWKNGAKDRDLRTEPETAARAVAFATGPLDPIDVSEEEFERRRSEQLRQFEERYEAQLSTERAMADHDSES